MMWIWSTACQSGFRGENGERNECAPDNKESVHGWTASNPASDGPGPGGGLPEASPGGAGGHQGPGGRLRWRAARQDGPALPCRDGWQQEVLVDLSDAEGWELHRPVSSRALQ